MSFSPQFNINNAFLPQVLANTKRDNKSLPQKESIEAPRKWQYLLSDSLKFNGGQQYAIRIQKPHKALVFEYCVKIVSQQQVDTLYIEEHEFTHSELFNLTMLCKNKQVNLINLTKTSKAFTDNVIQGPW